MNVSRPLLLLMAIAAVGGAYYVLTLPDAEQRQRMDICKGWGVGGEQDLLRCRASSQEMQAVIEPARRRQIEADAKAYNADADALRAGKALFDGAAYTPSTVSELAKVLGLAPIVQTKAVQAFAGYGQRYRVSGTLIWSVPEDGEGWTPRRYSLVDRTGPGAGLISADIDSLSRDEREFAVDHCPEITFTPCPVIVYGHIGEVRSERNVVISTMGLLVDAIEFQPIDPAVVR